MNSDQENQFQAALISEISNLKTEILAVNQRLNMPVFRVPRLQFLRGMAFGLGSFLGATLVVSVLIYTLASINFIPIIGDWASQIAAQIQRN
ncbi:MAG: hypothetical protein GXP05_00590 [Alphaproteobacteria bacterium]|nr:hypothetical protein [Alphaproteobacteria bacterium]